MTDITDTMWGEGGGALNGFLDATSVQGYSAISCGVSLVTVHVRTVYPRPLVDDEVF